MYTGEAKSSGKKMREEEAGIIGELCKNIASFSSFDIVLSMEVWRGGGVFELAPTPLPNPNRAKNSCIRVLRGSLNH